jgi:hypothetical protein
MRSRLGGCQCATRRAITTLAHFLPAGLGVYATSESEPGRDLDALRVKQTLGDDVVDRIKIRLPVTER